MVDESERLLAFACASETGNQPGMTLRDYFAAAAMQGYLAAGTHRAYKSGAELTVGIAGAAYEMADSMLEVRQQD